MGKGYCGTIRDSHGHQLPLSAFFWLKSVHVSFQMHYLLLTEIIFEHSKLCGLHFVELFIFQLLFTRLA